MSIALTGALLPLALHAQEPGPARPASNDATKPAAKATATAETTKAATDPIERIKDEGLNRSQLMATLSYLTDVIGPRLTGSPNLKRANEWTCQTLTRWGLANAHLEAWGPFGKGWTLKRFSAQVIEPQCIPLIAFPKAWSPSTDGALAAQVVYFNAKTEADFAKYKGKVKGAIVLTGPPREVSARFEPLANRRTDKELLELADAGEPSANRFGMGGQPGNPNSNQGPNRGRARERAAGGGPGAARVRMLRVVRRAAVRPVGSPRRGGIDSAPRSAPRWNSLARRSNSWPMKAPRCWWTVATRAMAAPSLFRALRFLGLLGLQCPARRLRVDGSRSGTRMRPRFHPRS